MGIFGRPSRKPDVQLTAELVRELLRDQHPDLAERPIREGPRGWAAQMWRLGDDLVVRLPWQSETAGVIEEHTWLPRLAPHLPLPIPVPQRLGRPSERFPHPWIVTTWLDGQPADAAPATQGAAAADALAAFLTALHQPAPSDAPAGSQGRGGPLERVASLSRRFKSTTKLCAAAAGSHQELLPDPDAVRAVWDDALKAPRWAGPPRWLHGDLHPANVLTTADGRVGGVIDFGDLCAGDPALDLAAGWILLPDRPAIERFHEAYRPADDATWRRARGWAVWRAFGCLGIATSGPPGGKPSWGPPAVASLNRLTASAASRWR